MFSAQAIRQDFSRAAPHYDEAASLQQRVRAQALQLAKDSWNAGAHILDLGCGTGALVEDARGCGWDITGLDVAPGMCEMAQRKCSAVNADAAALPFAEAAFDGIFSSLMLQWSAYPHRVFQEIARILVPGGCSVIATLLPGTLHELETAFAALDDAPHVSRFTTKEALLSSAMNAALAVRLASEQALVDYHPGVTALLHSIKAIGGGNKALARKRGLMTPAQLAQLSSAYAAQCGSAQGIPATWKIFYLVVEKR